jgi:hypothetical protein
MGFLYFPFFHDYGPAASYIGFQFLEESVVSAVREDFPQWQPTAVCLGYFTYFPLPYMNLVLISSC